MEVDQHKEQKMHNHHGVRLFHEKLVALVDEWHSGDVIGEVKNKIHGLIREYGPEMYERKAVKDFDQFAWNFDRKHGIYIPKPYREDGRY